MPPPQAHTGLPAHLKKFRDEAIGAGFEEPILRRWSAHEVVSLHCHPFDVRAVVVEGEMQLTVDVSPTGVMEPLGDRHIGASR